MSWLELFSAKQAFRAQERARRRRQATNGKRHPLHVNRHSTIFSADSVLSPQSFALESLEPRMLLSATPSDSLIQEEAVLEPAAVTVPTLPNLDVDLNGQADALSDGMVLLRHGAAPAHVRIYGGCACRWSGRSRWAADNGRCHYSLFNQPAAVDVRH